MMCSAFLFFILQTKNKRVFLTINDERSDIITSTYLTQDHFHHTLYGKKSESLIKKRKKRKKTPAKRCTTTPTELFVDTHFPNLTNKAGRATQYTIT